MKGIAGIIFFTYLLHRPHEQALQGRQQIGDGHHDDGADGCLWQHLGDLGREQIDRDQAHRTAVRELVRHLRRGVERVGVHHHQAGFQGAKHHHRVGEAVGHLDGDAIARGKAGDLAQIHRKGVGMPVHVRKRQPALRPVGQPQRECGLRGELLRRRTDDRGHVRVLQGWQVRRGLGMVELSPRTQGRHGPKLQAERKK